MLVEWLSIDERERNEIPTRIVSEQAMNCDLQAPPLKSIYVLRASVSAPRNSLIENQR